MAENSTNPVDTNRNPVGDGEGANNPVSNPESSPKGNDQVSYESHKKLLDEKKSLQGQMREMQKQIELFAQREKERETKALETQNNYKELYERTKEEREQLKTQMEARDARILEEMKKREFLSRLGGKLRDPSYMNHVDLSKIIADPKTGEIELDSVENAVQDFKKRHAFLIESSTPINTPTARPGATSAPKNDSSITAEKVMRGELSIEELKKLHRNGR